MQQHKKPHIILCGLCAFLHFVAELWMLKLELKRKMPKRWAGEDQFVSKMGSLHRLAVMELFI